MKKNIQQIKLSSLSRALKIAGLSALLFLFKNSILSQNLIQNCSFELSTNIDCVTGDFSAVDNWTRISSPDYFNSFCSSGSGSSNPFNSFGVSYPKRGNAYCGIATYYKTIETKEYIQQHLNTSLISDKSYYVSFYVSRSDIITYSIKNIGAYFSILQPTVASSTYFPATPQVENQSGFLTDTASWTKVEGYFKAQGGEQYITIGNFNSNANTDTIYSGSTNPFAGDPNLAYYYIDSVSLYDSLSYATGLNNLKKMQGFSLYPNPTVGNLTLALSKVEGTGQRDYMIKIYDVVGREVKALEYEEEIDISDLEKGIYFLSLYNNGNLIGTKKVVKE